MKAILKKYWRRLSLTAVLVIAESVAWILFPLFMGWAIDDIIKNSYNGLLALAGLGIFALIVGAGRRLFDSRTYGKVYEDITTKTATNSQLSTSKKTARVRLLNEMVEFMEESMPELVSSVITFVGTLAIIIFLDLSIFAGCMLLMIVTVVVYGLSSRRTVTYNKKHNDELENQVDAIESKDQHSFRNHVRKLVRFNIKLSDLETVNYSIVMLASVGLVAFSIVTAGQNNLPAGEIFAIVTYVFQLISGLGELPIYYQQVLRLSDISKRISE